MDDRKLGISISIMNLKNHIAKSHLRVMVGLLQGQSMIVDENGNNCTFNTSTHNPLDLINKQQFEIGKLTNINNINMEEIQLINKADGSTIYWQEEYKFLRNYKQLIGNNDLYLGIQVVEKPKPAQLQQLNKDAKMNNQGNFGGMEFDLKGWQFFKLNDGNKIRNGNHVINLYDKPLRKVPVDIRKVKEMDMQIDFNVNTFEYDEAMLEKLRRKKKAKKQKRIQDVVEDNRISMNDLEKKPEQNDSAFIENRKQQYKDKNFEKGMGVDFYIDGARFLPDNVTIVKVVMQVYNSKCRIVFDSEAGLAELDSYNYNPTFFFRRELRKEWFDPTCTVLISIDTIDKASGEIRIVGYSSINLFINRFSKEQPNSENDSDVILQSGCYQLPIYCQEPYRTAPFTNQKLLKLEKLPCASLLVRIYQAPLSEDGLRTLNLVDFPDKSLWNKLGLCPDRPYYSTGAYNTQFYEIRDSENDLFIHRLTRVQMTVRESGYLILKSKGISKKMEDSELFTYIDNNLNKAKNTLILDMMYFAKYQPAAGFKFSLDGFHNTPKNQIYVGIYCLNPPGVFYSDKGNKAETIKEVHLNSNFNWDSPLRSPQFLEGFATFNDIKFSRYLHIIIDIKSINFDKVEPEITDIGWTVCPIFKADGYVISNIYQIPVIEGQMTSQLATAFQKTDAWQYIHDDMNDKRKKASQKLKYIKNMSIICRVLDSQREGHFKNPFDPNRINYNYLPKDQLKYYAYNQAEATKLQQSKKMNTLIPLKGNSNTFNTKITNSFVKKYDMKQYEVI